MKEVMAKASSSNAQGVPSFEYNPVTLPRQQLDLELGSGPLDRLAATLLEEFAGTTLTMIEIYDQHNVGTPFIKANYKDALVKLEERRQIITAPPASNRPIRQGKRTFADSVRVTFAKKKKK
jgi:hypothetical protein